jgi:lipid II:glycine glycyltransferase (peptidoglycan interpeptide bridge formation enzyme)
MEFAHFYIYQRAYWRAAISNCMIWIMVETLKSATQQNPIAPTAWDAFVGAHTYANLLQTSAWGKLKGRYGWQDRIVSVANGAGAPLAGALLLFRRAYGLTFAYAPKGPLTDWSQSDLTSELLATLAAAGREQGALFLKIEPDLPDTPANRTMLYHYGLQPSPQTIQPQSTILLDISGSEEAILQHMKAKWRYNIRLAERKGITVRAATRSDLPAFNAMMAITGERDGFAVRNAGYYNTAFDLLAPQHGVFLLAEYKGEPLAALVVCVTGRLACYLWGASSERERNRMPNHALQWAAIRWARERGATAYDFYGIPDDLGRVALGLRCGDGGGAPVEDLPLDLDALPHYDLWGVYRFKQGFGGNVVRFVGAWDLPLHKLGYRVYHLALSLQKQRKQHKNLLLVAHSTAVGHATSVTTTSVTSSVTSTPKTTGAAPAPALRRIAHAHEWCIILASLPDPHVLQSWEWGEIKAQTEWHASRYVLYQNGTPQAAFQILYRQPIPYIPLRIGYIPKGPLLDWEDLDLVDTTLQQIEQVARAAGCIFVKIDPDVREDWITGRLALHALERRGWRFSGDQIQFKNTAFTDLTTGENMLLEQMKGKWRYNVRLAERRGIGVRQGGAADLAAFYALYAETGRRDGFLIRPYSYYHTTWQTFLAAQTEQENPAGATLLLAEHPEDPRPMAGLFLLKYGRRAWYFYGASSERHRRDMPNYLLQWEALRWAQAQGCTVYDWWGAPADIDDPHDSMQGVWQFKQGFGAQFQPHIGAWDFPVFPALYRLFTGVMPQVIAFLQERHQR